MSAKQKNLNGAAHRTDAIPEESGSASVVRTDAEKRSAAIAAAVRASMAAGKSSYAGAAAAAAKVGRKPDQSKNRATMAMQDGRILTVSDFTPHDSDDVQTRILAASYAAKTSTYSASVDSPVTGLDGKAVKNRETLPTVPFGAAVRAAAEYLGEEGAIAFTDAHALPRDLEKLVNLS